MGNTYLETAMVNRAGRDTDRNAEAGYDAWATTPGSGGGACGKVGKCGLIATLTVTFQDPKNLLRARSSGG